MLLYTRRAILSSMFLNPLMPVGNYSYQFFICCPRDCVSHTSSVRECNGGTSGAPLKPFRVDSALRALSTLRGLRGAPEVPPLCRETQSLGIMGERTANVERNVRHWWVNQEDTPYANDPGGPCLNPSIYFHICQKTEFSKL